MYLGLFIMIGKRDSASSVISRAAALYPKDRPTKRSAPVDKSTSKRIKTEDLRENRNPLDRYKNILVTAAGPQQTDYELSHLMTNIVENELNLLMNKIYDTFPKEITNEAEEIVHNKYKGQVGAALRNTIGLNITKRLLNVHDRLLVKLTFSNTPSGKDLDKFINTYKLINFKKIPHLALTYVADLKSYTDLDNLCSIKNLRCGSIDIIAKPCIPFMKCPQNLKTKFRSGYLQTEQKQTDTESGKILDIKVEQDKTDHNTEITNKDDNKTKYSKVKATESKESNQNPKSQEVTKASTQNKSQETPKVIEPTRPTQTKPEAVAKVKTTPTKTEEKTIIIATENATKVKTPAIKTEKTTPTKTEESNNAKTITIKTEKTTPLKTEETPEARTTPRKTEATATIMKTEETKAKATAPKTITDTEKQKTSATNTETITTKTESTPKVKATPTKSEESPKAKTGETVKITATKTDTTTAQTTSTNIETTTKAKTETTSNLTPAKTESKVLKTQDTQKTTPKTQENKIKTPNEVNKTTTQTKTPITPKSKEETRSKPLNTTNTNTKTAKTTVTKKEVVNRNKEVKKLPERKKKANDFDELDDQDILAMLSGGIILDECSGSDDE